MKLNALLITLLMLLGSSQLADAQLLKRLKEKVKNAVEETTERKVEDKAAQVTDSAIDSLFAIGNGSKTKKKPKKETTPTASEGIEDLGDAMISAPQHGGISIDNVGATNVEVTDSETIIWSSWWTHSADIHDGYRLVLGQPIDLNNKSGFLNKPMTGTLELAYDSSLPIYAPEDDNGRVRAVTEDYSQSTISPVTITFAALDEEHIQFKFSGNGYKGGISVMYPKFTEKASATPEKAMASQGKKQVAKPRKGEADTGTYSFDVKIETMISTQEGEQFPITYLINSSEDYYGMETDMGAYGEGDVTGSSTIVIDAMGNTRIFVDSPMMKMQISQKSAGAQSQVPEYGDYNYSKPVKTGNVKTILGYTCHEYSIEQDGGKMTFWAAPDVDIPNWMFGGKDAVEQTGVLGFVMEFAASGSDGNTKSTVTAIKEGIDFTINASEYKKMF